MKEEKLKELVERYYNGNTSEEEELMLREYFSGNDILPGYEAEKEIFRYYCIHDEIIAPDDLESRIVRSIDTPEGKHFFKTKRLIILSVAASLLILICSYLFFVSKSGLKDTFNDPQVAYLEAKRILYDVSIKLNRGTLALQNVARINKKAQAGLESAEKSVSLISGQIERIENLGKLPEPVEPKE